ncbi:MAG: class I SAM-dependent RNA methyltransferase [Myxococcales bacterium]
MHSLVPRRPTRVPSATRSKPSNLLEAYAATAPGLEPLAARELAALGLAPNAETGGAAFRGPVESIWRANLWLRTASRVVVRVASFRAQAFHELERLARAVPWELYVASGSAVRFRVTSKKSRLYHTGGIAQRFGEAIEHRLGGGIVIGDSRSDEGDEEEVGGSAAQLFVIRVFHDVFTVSADSSGALLHQRGYRKAIGKAPLRETLAAAMLLASDWSGSTPLIDPLCGSGTIPIEAALIARRIAPGASRSFAFQAWPSFDGARWEAVRADAAEGVLPTAGVRISGSDRDTGAIQAAVSNAERAGVTADLELTVRAISAIEDCNGGDGLMATNPPYGVRVGEAAGLRDLYARLGQILRAKCPGWRLAMLSANSRLEGELRLPLEERMRTRNGGIPVRLMTARVPA